MTSFRKYPACSCLAKWLPAYEAELKRRGILPKSGSLRIYQLIGGAKASGGTHSTGGCFDLLDLPGGEDIRIARQMGADATWSRLYDWDNKEGMAHVHGVLTGCPHNGPARYQIDAVRAGYNGLGRGGRAARDTGPRPLSGRTWQQGIAWAKAQAKAAKKASKPTKPVKPWFNVGFLNTWGNSIAGGKASSIAARTPSMVDTAVAGSPASAAFCEVRPSQRGSLTRAMTERGYRLVAKDGGNMLAVYARPNVTSVGSSFARFSQQDGGNVEGVLRVKFKVDGSRAQVGVIHLDHDSSEAKKRHNLKQAYDALRRYGIATLLPNWKTRTVIIGDFNDPNVATKVLKPLGFKQMDTDRAPIDQAWVGAKRADRGGAATSTKSDHKRILARLGRS